LGNIIWKEHALKGVISLEEAMRRAEDMAKLLEIMHIKGLGSSEDFGRTIKLAAELELTFYDASYLYVANSCGLTLVTENEEFMDKAKRVNIKTITVSELLESHPSSGS